MGLFCWPIGPQGTPVWRRDRRWGERVKQRTKSAWSHILLNRSHKWHHQLQSSWEPLLYLNPSSLFKVRNDQEWMNFPRWYVITRARLARRDIFVLFNALLRANGSLWWLTWTLFSYLQSIFSEHLCQDVQHLFSRLSSFFFETSFQVTVDLSCFLVDKIRLLPYPARVALIFMTIPVLCHFSWHSLASLLRWLPFFYFAPSSKVAFWCVWTLILRFEGCLWSLFWPSQSWYLQGTYYICWICTKFYKSMERQSTLIL